MQSSSLLRCFTGKSSSVLCLPHLRSVGGITYPYGLKCSTLSVAIAVWNFGQQASQMSTLTNKRVVQPSIDMVLKRSKQDGGGVGPSSKKVKNEVGGGDGKTSQQLDEEAAHKTVPKKPVSDDVNVNRVRTLKDGPADKKGPVIYWVSRDQRSRDNWALLHAIQEANKRGAPVAVVFNLLESFLGAKARHFGFMLRGLRVLEKNLAASNIPFFLFRGKAEDTIPAFLNECDASLLVMDFSPLKIGRVWRDAICANVSPSVTVHEVDAHNVSPVWVTSAKMEYGARTIRTKIHKLLPEYLVEFPELKPPKVPWTSLDPDPIFWDKLIEEVISVGAEVPEVEWCEPGEDAALEALYGSKNGFLTKRLQKYEDRNDPSKGGSLSGLSPYLHFGHISAQRAALEARRVRKNCPKSVDSFLEELVVRRELSENFCYYQPNYDNMNGAWDWAQKTLRDHASDKREFLYTREKLEKGRTHDKLWNAAQLEMVHHGKMHGYMRMYWAKKILEWTLSPEDALEIAIYLNDKYELDGRDPNGYVGCMWSICGIHDQVSEGWKERPVFGKIRYMNYAGCNRKFNIEAYIAQVDRIISMVKKKAKETGTLAGAAKYCKSKIT
ncbi:unnamed protein product [Calypogeia fissa]